MTTASHVAEAKSEKNAPVKFLNLNLRVKKDFDQKDLCIGRLSGERRKNNHAENFIYVDDDANYGEDRMDQNKMNRRKMQHS